ncbi:MAG TPA: hypothetical protein VJJ52_07310 [Candidatus Nanoarchaeia archaeon]|nr:hypothetical protein [Candidatus Nanoarchaeia archaeon]
MKKCPKCNSKDVKLISYLGINVIKCNKCGFDERVVYDVYPEQKTNQKAKGKYNVYKTGGSLRTRKK